MSKKHNEDVIFKKDLIANGWTNELIEKLLPKQLKTGGWYVSTVKNAEATTTFIKTTGKTDNQYKTYPSKPINRRVAKFMETIAINPSEDYPAARSMYRHFIINVGETNTGKTYTALQALKQAKDGVYLSPLRLLAMEVQDTLLESGCLCSMTTGEEEKIIPNSTVMSSTVEKLNINHKYDVGVIDECQMISDSARGGAWVRAILGIQANIIYLCMSEDALDLCIKLIDLCGDTYEVNRCERTTKLTMMTEPVKASQLEKGDAIILFSRKAVLECALTLERLGVKVSVIYGALPYEARKHQVDLYRRGETDVVVSTDAIGMGLNLPIRRILFAESSKFDGISHRELRTQEVLQIAGRAGRRGIYEEGFVSVLEESKTSLKLISEIFYKTPKTIKKAYIPFPEECIGERKKISDVMMLWKQVKYPSMFFTEDVTVRLQKIKYLEKHYPEMEKEKKLLLSKVVFDERNDGLELLFKKYIQRYVDCEVIYSPYNKTYTDLKMLEQNYKELQLFYSFHRTMDLYIDLEELEENKADLVERINTEILKQRKDAKLHVRKCRYCGTELPPFFKFGICERCFRRDRYYYDDEYEFADWSKETKSSEDLPF